MPARKETRLRGRTWVNRWQPIDGTSNGVTVSTDETGLNAGDSVVYEVEQTVEWLDNVTLPELPETFCEYPVSDVPCRESVVYELAG